MLRLAIYIFRRNGKRILVHMYGKRGSEQNKKREIPSIPSRYRARSKNFNISSKRGIDTLNASKGEGMLAIEAAKMANYGVSATELKRILSLVSVVFCLIWNFKRKTNGKWGTYE